MKLELQTEPGPPEKEPTRELYWYGIAVILILIAACQMGCASTVIYRDGKPLAIIQGNLTGSLTMAADGSMVISGTLNHSDATEAAGRAAAGKINASAALVTAALLAP